MKIVRLYLSAMLLGLGGCGSAVLPPVLPDTPDPSAPNRAMDMYDTNKDGFLDAKELEKAPGLKAALDRLDTSHRGKISSDEIAARIKFWADSKVGRMPVSCRVLHNGEPLAGAKVVFAPEKFLGDGLQSGSGTTDRQGIAWISSPYAADPSVKGLSPGFYRIQITKDGERVPARFNVETTLGAEVAPRAEKNGFRSGRNKEWTSPERRGTDGPL